MASANYISFALMMKLSSVHMSEESLNCCQIADPPDYSINISKDGFELTWDCRVWYLWIESSITSTLCPHPSIVGESCRSLSHPGPITRLSQDEGEIIVPINEHVENMQTACK